MVETELGKRPSVSQLVEGEVQVAVRTAHASFLRQVLGERVLPLIGGWRRSATFGPRDLHPKGRSWGMEAWSALFHHSVHARLANGVGADGGGLATVEVAWHLPAVLLVRRHATGRTGFHGVVVAPLKHNTRSARRV